MALRLDLPPPASALVKLPKDAPARFVVFGDAEEEFDWSQPFSRHSVATTAIAALPEATRVFNDAGVTPTYLVDWPVANAQPSAAIVRELWQLGRCEIGAQLHPWVNPPFEEDINERSSYLGNLSQDLQRAKLGILTTKLESAIGVRPTVFRAGRYGVSSVTGRLLSDLGFVLDVSVRSLFDYRSQHGPDFRHHPVVPWRIDRGLYELPLTAVWTGGLRNVGWMRRQSSLLSRARLANRVPLTPEGVPLNDAIRAVDRLIENGQKIFSLSFHTPSLVPGHTPYVRDLSDLKHFHAWWRGLFAHFQRRGVMPIKSSELAPLLDAAWHDR